VVVSLHPVPVAFDEAVESIRAVEFRSDLRVQEIRSPEGLAPHALALAADVSPENLDGDSQLGTGRFILLHDPAEPEAWRGDFRVVCFAQAPLETDIGGDGMLPEVAWSWLVDALDENGADYRYPSGTVTVVNSKGFGELTEQGLVDAAIVRYRDARHGLVDAPVLACRLAPGRLTRCPRAASRGARPWPPLTTSASSAAGSRSSTPISR
jgi:hypothetical protein